VSLACLIAPIVCAATYTVTTTVNPGAGSLSQAIDDANANPGLDSIHFAIPGSPPFVITGGGVISSPLNLDGTTQPGFSGKPVVVIRATETPFTYAPPDYDRATSRTAMLTFVEGSEGSTVRALVLNNATTAIAPWKDTTIVGNYIGTDSSGNGAAPNGVGVLITTDNVHITGNVISGNTYYGIQLSRDTRAVIDGNYIGTNAAGSAALPNGWSGIWSVVNWLASPNQDATIRGNVISGNGRSGFAAAIFTTSLTLTFMNLQIVDNVIGLDASRTVAIPNGLDGISLPNYDFSVISGNVISSNRRAGIWVDYFEMGRGHLSITNNTIVGNAQDGIHTTAGFLRAVPLATAWPLVDSNDIHGNGENGITADALQQIRRNSIYDNGGLAIATHAFPLSFNTLDNMALNTPRINDARVTAGRTLVRGALLSYPPSTTFAVDLFDNDVCDASGFGEARAYVASQTIVTDAAGNARFEITVPQELHIVTAIATVTARPDCNLASIGHCTAYASTSVSNCVVVSDIPLPALSPLMLALLCAFLAAIGIVTAAARP